MDPKGGAKWAGGIRFVLQKFSVDGLGNWSVLQFESYQ